MTTIFDTLFHNVPVRSVNPHRPIITLSYAQSLDGCIAAAAGKPTRLSGPESMKMTHQLRATHDGLLVGIGTILADDPQLTTRLVAGPDPQPIILDSHIRTPAGANVLKHTRKVYIACSEGTSKDRKTILHESGAELIPISRCKEDNLDLREILQSLKMRGINSIMVEGGGKVITSFIDQELVDVLVLTIAPRIIGGLRAPGKLLHAQPKLNTLEWIKAGQDMIAWGTLKEPLR